MLNSSKSSILIRWKFWSQQLIYLPLKTQGTLLQRSCIFQVLHHCSLVVTLEQQGWTLLVSPPQTTSVHGGNRAQLSACHRQRWLIGESGEKALTKPSSIQGEQAEPLVPVTLPGFSAPPSPDSCGPDVGSQSVMLSRQLNFCAPTRCTLYTMKSQHRGLSLIPNNMDSF